MSGSAGGRSHRGGIDIGWIVRFAADVGAIAPAQSGEDQRWAWRRPHSGLTALQLAAVNQLLKNIAGRWERV